MPAPIKPYFGINIKLRMMFTNATVPWPKTLALCLSIDDNKVPNAINSFLNRLKNANDIFEVHSHMQLT